MSVLTPAPASVGRRSGNLNRRKTVNALMLTLCVLAAGLAISILGLVLYFLLSKGFSSLHLSLFTKLPDGDNPEKGGMAQSIVGTLILLGVSSVIGLPLGILGASTRWRRAASLRPWSGSSPTS